jgi:tRNA A-37 threonylcarbamoyl transferase component Bud32
MYTDAASTPTYKEKQMAMMHPSLGQIYDQNRDMYTDRYTYEQACRDQDRYFHQKREEERRWMQNGYNNAMQSPQAISQAPTPDPKNPLAFLNKTHNKLLLTGEAL